MWIKTARGKTKNLKASTAAIWNELDDGVQYMISPEYVGTFGLAPNPYDRLDNGEPAVAYRREPDMEDGRRRDHYQPWHEVLAQRHGDCEDFAMWRVAYLRQSGIDPKARVCLIEWPAGGWHAIVATRVRTQEPGAYGYTDPAALHGAKVYLGPGIKSLDGWFLEDPSYILGMHDPSKAEEYSDRVELAQAEPNGTVGNDPFVPFELAGADDSVATSRAQVESIHAIADIDDLAERLSDEVLETSEELDDSDYYDEDFDDELEDEDDEDDNKKKKPAQGVEVVDRRPSLFSTAGQTSISSPVLFTKETGVTATQLYKHGTPKRVYDNTIGKMKPWHWLVVAGAVGAGMYFYGKSRKSKRPVGV